MIDFLVDKRDNFELVRDQIAAILTAETASQQALAAAADLDPSPWAFKVYSERSNPWEAFREGCPNEPPIVNVWFDSETFPENASNPIERQRARGSFNVDCYARCATVENLDAPGQTAGDQSAALEAQRTARLVRNFLMAATHTYLGMRGVVAGRSVQSLTVFQPSLGASPVEQVVAARLTLTVDFNEFSPQVTPQTLDLVSNDVKRNNDGLIVLEADYQSTT